MTFSSQGGDPYELEKAARQGNMDAAAGLEAQRARRDAIAFGVRPGPSAEPWPIWPFAMLGIAWVLSVLGAAVVAGAQWLGTDSWLAPLFPAPGDSLLRYIVGTGILILLLPGGLMTLAATLRDTRARALSIPLVVIAVLLIPLLLWTTQLTSTAPVERVW